MHRACARDPAPRRHRRKHRYQGQGGLRMTSPIRPMPAIDGSDSEPQPASSDTTRIRILLVDDDELFRESLAMNLADEEFQVTECINGKACLDGLRDNAGFDQIGRAACRERVCTYV